MADEIGKNVSAESWSIPRIRNTLLRNPTVNGDEAIAELLLAKGKREDFEAGHEFIRAGPSSDEIYFLLAGTARVMLADGTTRTRHPPTQIGEMAVLDRGSDRSACVQAGVGGLVTWKITGDCLTEILDLHPAARERMRSEMAGRHRELASRIPIKSGPGPIAWTILSILAALLSGYATWWFATQAGASVGVRMVVATAAALISYVVVQSRNPAFFWRRMFAALVVFAIVAISMQRSITVEATNGTRGVKFDLSSNGLTVSEGTLGLMIGAWLFALAACVFFEYRRDRAS